MECIFAHIQQVTYLTFLPIPIDIVVNMSPIPLGTSFDERRSRGRTGR